MLRGFDAVSTPNTCCLHLSKISLSCSRRVWKGGSYGLPGDYGVLSGMSLPYPLWRPEVVRTIDAKPTDGEWFRFIGKLIRLYSPYPYRVSRHPTYATEASYRRHRSYDIYGEYALHDRLIGRRPIGISYL